MDWKKYIPHSYYCCRVDSYLETNGWELTQALQEAQEDAAWERQEAKRHKAAVAQRAKMEDNTNPYASHDSDEKKEDMDCLACFSFVVSALRSLTKAWEEAICKN